MCFWKICLWLNNKTKKAPIPFPDSRSVLPEWTSDPKKWAVLKLRINKVKYVWALFPSLKMIVWVQTGPDKVGLGSYFKFECHQLFSLTARYSPQSSYFPTFHLAWANTLTKYYMSKYSLKIYLFYSRITTSSSNSE